MRQGRLAAALCAVSRACLALGELLAAPGLVQADFLALDLARVAGHESSLGERRLELGVVVDERARDAMAHRSGLARLSATIYVDHDVEGRFVIRQFQWLAHDHTPGLTGKELV